MIKRPAEYLPLNYRPEEDPTYMSPEMLRYFKDKLDKLHKDILEKEHSISTEIMHNPLRESDIVDAGEVEELRYHDFMLQEHEDHLRYDVEEALKRIAQGIYGYCDQTGKPIGIKRLQVVPWARLCADAANNTSKTPT